MKNSRFKAIIFDLGNVLINWDPRHVFNDTYFDSIEKRDHFLEKICSMDWNERQDEGRSIVEATQELVAQYPEWESSIRDYYGRWTDMLGGAIAETVEIFRRLKESGQYKIYALTNWQAGLFDIALVRYAFLHWFDGRVVSGEEKMRKPEPAFYERLLDRYTISPSEALFIDDNLRNIKAAEAMGIRSIHFTSPAALERSLKELGVL
ncbi:MAG: HAD family phosphatase [Terrimonas ferruginea]|uniref:HAD family hydrolase n=1 Tax=Terrimonas ferruginea TaxID=249 RepID=UPI0009262264|nr:HAD family phosphatase [Terrimonas ferruginea]MBN8782208.1 HAD family phosphatase [Terrimonas ferruginea]OJW42740.1 MAG: HAD family hydrolase [Sphingobacteriales bacterium 48-107]